MNNKGRLKPIGISEAFIIHLVWWQYFVLNHLLLQSFLLLY